MESERHRGQNEVSRLVQDVRTLTGAEISKDNIAEQCLRSLSLAGIVETEGTEP